MSSKPQIKPRLVIIEGKDKGKIIPLSDGTAIIGRSKGDVVIQDPRVSRSHIAIHYDSKSEKLSYTDLKSLNGTQVNGASSEAGELHDGDKLQLGNTIFDCQLSIALDEETSVSKIKDQLKKYKEEAEVARKALSEKANIAEASKSNVSKSEVSKSDLSKSESSKKEPKLVPLGGISSVVFDTKEDKNKQLADTKEQIQPVFSETKTTHIDDERDSKTKKHRLPNIKLKSSYKKIPRFVRVACLAAVLGLFLSFLIWDRGTSNEDSSLQSTVANINKLTAKNQLDEALTRALQLKEKHSTDSRTYLLLGNIYTLQEKNELAIEAYEMCHQLSPPLPISHVKLIRVLLRSGYIKRAESELPHIDKVFKEGLADTDTFIDAAHLFLEFPDKLVQPPEAALKLAKALQTEKAPKSTVGYKLEAQTLAQKKQYEEALGVLTQALKMDPKDEWLLENTFYAQLYLKDMAAAQTTVEKWIEYRPTASKALLIMAYLKFNENNPQSAAPYVDRILDYGRLNPKDEHLPEALYLKGQLLFKEQRIEEASNYFRLSCQGGFQKACNPELAYGGKDASASSAATSTTPSIAPNTTPPKTPSYPSSSLPPAEQPGANIDLTKIIDKPVSDPSPKAPSADFNNPVQPQTDSEQTAPNIQINPNSADLPTE